jgi:hypothetical protein
MLEAALEESAPSLLGAGGVVVDGIFVEGAPNMIRAGLEEQAPSFSGAVDDGIASFVFGVDEEDTISEGVKAQYMQTHYSMNPGYVKPYPLEVDMVPFPDNYRQPQFTKFNGTG